MSDVPFRVFFSYAHEDEQLRDQLAKHLSLLERSRKATLICDRGLLPGEEWNPAIASQITSSQIVLVLVSPAYFSSDYCLTELALALECHWTRKVIVVPVIMRPVDWSKSLLSDFQALPRNGLPVVKWLLPDDAFVDISLGIRRLLDSLTKDPAPQADSIALSNLHFSPKEYFTDREALLLNLHDQHTASGNNLTIQVHWHIRNWEDRNCN